MAYLKINGHDIHKATYYRIKGALEATKLKRLHEIAQIGFVDQHLERIDQLELIQKLMWENYHLEKSPFRKVMILKEIKDVQPYLSSYYESTKDVMEGNKQADNPLSDISQPQA